MEECSQLSEPVALNADTCYQEHLLNLSVICVLECSLSLSGEARPCTKVERGMASLFNEIYCLCGFANINPVIRRGLTPQNLESVAEII